MFLTGLAGFRLKPVSGQNSPYSRFAGQSCSL